MDESGAPVFGSVCLCNTSLCNGIGVANSVKMVPNMDVFIPLFVVLISCFILCVCNVIVCRGYIRRILIKGFSILHCLQRENGRQVQKYVNGWFANKWSWEYTVSTANCDYHWKKQDKQEKAPKKNTNPIRLDIQLSTSWSEVGYLGRIDRSLTTMSGAGSVQEGSSSNRKRSRNLAPAELNRNCVSRRR